MKLIHLSDLHLGKRVNEFSMLEDQQYILAEILQIIDREAPDGVLIAGDVYDKSVPSAEAVALLDDFLVRLSRRKLQVFVISGNHDSPERMAFGGRLMERSGVHLAPVYDGKVEPVALSDEYGPVKVYLLPFVKPSHVRRCFPDREIATYTDALSVAIGAMEVDEAERNVLVTHQFVTGAARCDSEEISVGRNGQCGRRRLCPLRLCGPGPHPWPSAGGPGDGALLRHPAEILLLRVRTARSRSPWWSWGRRGAWPSARCPSPLCGTWWSCGAPMRS